MFLVPSVSVLAFVSLVHAHGSHWLHTLVILLSSRVFVCLTMATVTPSYGTASILVPCCLSRASVCLCKNTLLAQTNCELK